MAITIAESQVPSNEGALKEIYLQQPQKTIDTQALMQEESPKRLHHPLWLVVLLGGISGVLINLLVTFGCYRLLHQPEISFFLGTMANQVFHIFYYRFVFIQSPRLEIASSWWYFFVSILAVTVASILMRYFEFSFVTTTLSIIAILSTLNLLFIRMSDLASAGLAQIQYTEVSQDFYEEQSDSSKVNAIRAWYHSFRFSRLQKFVSEYYRQGMRIADFGCGNCMWNQAHLPVIGVDINEAMMRWAKNKNRLVEYHVRPDLSNTKLEERSCDIIIMSETLEHLSNLDAVMQEVGRVLKNDGVFLITVPYDFFFSPFFLLFNLNCFYQGFIRNSAYHRLRCGHIHHFSKKILEQQLAKNGWKVERLFVVRGLILYASARKTLKMTESAFK